MPKETPEDHCLSAVPWGECSGKSSHHLEVALTAAQLEIRIFPRGQNSEKKKKAADMALSVQTSVHTSTRLWMFACTHIYKNVLKRTYIIRISYIYIYCTYTYYIDYTYVVYAWIDA